MELAEKKKLIDKMRSEKEKFLKEVKPKIDKKINDIIKEFEEKIKGLGIDFEVEGTQLTIGSALKKYQSKGLRVYPAVLRVDGELALCLVYTDGVSKKEVVKATSAPMAELINISRVLDEFLTILESALIERMYEKVSEDYKEVERLAEEYERAYNVYLNAYERLKEFIDKLQGGSQD